MFEVIKQNETVAARRRMYFTICDSSDAVSGKVITTTGVKMRLSKNGAASAASTADIMAVDPTNEPGKHYIELTAAEADTIGQVIGLLPASVPNGYLAASAQASVVAYDPYADGASVTTIAAGVRTELTTELADVVAIKAKTDNLPTDPADESLIIAATDAIQAAIAALNNLSAAGVRAAVGLAAADLDTQLAAIPTAAENAAELIAEAAATPIAADVQKVNAVTIVGDGSSVPFGV